MPRSLLFARIETLDDRWPNQSPRIRIWLPPGYDMDMRRYPVLYVLDGQWAFADDAEGANFAVDTRMAQLADAGRVEPHLIVAIDNLGDERFVQYMPQAIYDGASDTVRAVVERDLARVGADRLRSASFIAWLEGELKPYVDTRYRTRPGRLDTAIFGASVAGVMAGAIFVEAQGSFGRGACMSPNWPIYDERMIDHAGLAEQWADYFAQIGAPGGRRLWLDHGTQMMDAGMAPYQFAIAGRLAQLGWERGEHLRTEVYHAGHAFAQTAYQMDDLLGWLLA
ncbi:hypothetical protein AAW01_10405 [Aurantiacibacter gangjinensis]|uniref:Esterase n=1 Tax=Aurantiacibacter gangjinensis TaxID=502682 RepID=A0A0G9MSG7_9SPHN|nr:hypothetical protein AAW01_10405 [Aurantiacibacter gangjinensis]